MQKMDTKKILKAESSAWLAANQRAKSAETGAEKWYSGGKPTTRETIARINDVSAGDKTTFNNLYSKFLTAQDTKGSIYYNPYAKATNSKAIDGLAGLGVDVSGGITQDFLDQYAGLRNYDRTASGYSPLAPTKSSTPEQNAAYYFNQLQDAEPTTKAAEQEWAQMQKELTYWANRGLSDEEAIAKLDWKNYKTLAKMDEKKSTGDALILNRPVGYSSDAMYGTLWAARNNGGTGNALADMANSARGVGNVYKRDAFAEDQRNPASKNYNPYTRATIDSALINLGVDKIDDEWLAANRSMLATDQADLYRDLYEINEDTKVAQAEYALLQKNVDRWLKAGYSAEDIARVFEEDADNEYGTLKKMDEARLLGKPYALGDAVNYRWEDVYEYARQKRAELDAPIDVQAEARKEEYINKNGSLTSGDTRETTITPRIVAEPESPKEIEEAADKWLEIPQEYDNPLDAMDARIALEQAGETEQAETGASKLPEGAKVMAGAGASDVVFTSTNQTRADEIDATLANIEAELDGLPEGEYKAALEQQKRELEAEKISLQGARTNEMRDDLGADPIDPPENGYNPPKADSEAAVTPDGGTNRVDKIDETLANIEAGLVDLPDGEYKNALEQQKRELEAERISLQGDAANKMLVEEKTDLQLDTKIADYQTVSQQIADLESTTEVDPEVLADIDAQREELKQELANNQIDKAMYDKLMKRVDERLAFWQETAEEENRPEREKLTAEKDRLEGELLDVIRSGDATRQEKISAAKTIGAWDAAAKYQFDAIKEKLSANAEYSKFLEANGGAQAAAEVLCSYVLAGEDLKNLENLDEATRGALVEYQNFCTEALGMYEDKELYSFLDAALGGALKSTKYNEGVGWFNTILNGVGMGAAQFDDVLADVVGTAITAYGYMVEGSEWLCEQLGLGKANTSEKYKQAGTAVSSYYDKQYAKIDQYLLDNASTLEYFVARGTGEGVKIAGEVVAGKAGVSLVQKASKTLQTSLEALKLERVVKAASQLPFVAESGAGTLMDTYEQTGDILRSTVAGAASAMATMSTADLGVLSQMDEVGAPFVQSVIDKVAAVPGSGAASALKRWGIAGMQFFGNLAKTGGGEGLQEVIEYALSEPVVYAMQEGKSFFSRNLKEIGAEAAGNFIWGAISSFGSTMQTMPSYARSVVAAEGMMNNGKLTPKDVVTLIEAYQADLNDPVIVSEMEKNAEQDAVEVQTGLLIAQDTGLQSLIEASEDAKEAAVQAVASAEAAAAALDEAQSAVQENPSPETAQAYKEALADQTQAAAKAEQATAQSDQAAQKAAEGLAQKRSEAKSMIDLIQQSLAEQRKELRDAAQQEENLDLMDTSTGVVGYTDKEIANLSSPKGFVEGGEMSFSDFVKSSVRKAFDGVRNFYLGKLSNNLVSSVEATTGIDLKGFSLMIRNDEIVHMLSEHGKGKETRENQWPVTEGDIERISEVFNNPDSIVESKKKDYAGRKALEFTKKLPDGRKVVVTGVATGSKTLAIDTMYVFDGTKKESPSTPDAAEATNGITPEASRELTLNASSIARAPGDVNTSVSDSIGIIPPTNAPTTEQPSGARPEAQRQFGSQTAQRSEAIHEETKRWLYDHSGYVTDSNKAQVTRAIDRIETNGYTATLAEWLSKDLYKMNNADDQAMGVTLMGIAAHQGDTGSEVAIADKYNQLGTMAGQSLQARKIFNRLTPLGAMAYVQKQVARLNEEMATRGTGITIEVPTEILERISKAETGEARQSAVDDAIRHIAEQVPPTWGDRLNAWRYLSMLGNPRTHIRNVLGNAVFMPIVSAKNKIAAAMETVAQEAGWIDERTKTLDKIDQKYKEFARNDASDMADWLSGEAKYDDKTKIDRSRRSFGTSFAGKLLQKAVDKNSELLGKEDMLFKNMYYKEALAGYLQANNLDPNNLTEAQLDKAREYAYNEALKATYQDASEFVKALNKFAGSSKGAKLFVEGVLPFKKTPVNILKRGIEYSPVGLLNTIYKWGKSCKGKGEMTGVQFIDGLAAGLTGTAAMGLGMLLSSLGFIKGNLGDNKEDDFWSLLGRQEYSVEIGGVSYTVDWMTPIAMPVLAGAALREYSSESGWNANTISKAIMATAEPIFNLSMLDGVNSMIESAQYAEENGVTSVAVTAATGFLGQFIPTILGQLTRIADPVRRTIATSDESPIPKDLQYFVGQVLNKSILWSDLNEPYINTWGEQEVTDNVFLRIFENMFSPGYISKVDPDETEQALLALAKETGDDVYPTQASKSFTVAGQKIKLSPKEYTEFKTYVGQTKKSLLDEMVALPEFADLSSKYKAKIVEDVYKYAAQTGKHRMNDGYEMDKWIATAYEEGSAAESLLSRVHKEQADDEVDLLIADVGKSIMAGDFEALDSQIWLLKENGLSNTKIRNRIKDAVKDDYLKAWLDNDVELCSRIADTLLRLGVGFKYSEIEKWNEKE